MYALLFLLLTGCATVNLTKNDYLVSTAQGTFLCDEYNHGAYGSAAKKCEHVMLGYKVDSIPNPTTVTAIKE